MRAHPTITKAFAPNPVGTGVRLRAHHHARQCECRGGHRRGVHGHVPCGRHQYGIGFRCDDVRGWRCHGGQQRDQCRALGRNDPGQRLVHGDRERPVGVGGRLREHDRQSARSRRRTPARTRWPAARPSTCCRVSRWPRRSGPALHRHQRRERAHDHAHQRQRDGGHGRGLHRYVSGESREHGVGLGRHARAQAATVTAANNGASVALSGATVPASGSCTVTVNVTSATAGSYLNSTGSVATTNAGTAAAGTGTLTVLATSDDRQVVRTEPERHRTLTSLLTITLTNPNATPITGAAFTDTYPAGVVNTASASGATTCAGGTVTAANNGTSVALSGGTIPASGSCTVTVNATSSTPGTYANTIAIGALDYGQRRVQHGRRQWLAHDQLGALGGEGLRTGIGGHGRDERAHHHAHEPERRGGHGRGVHGHLSAEPGQHGLGLGCDDLRGWHRNRREQRHERGAFRWQRACGRLLHGDGERDDRTPPAATTTPPAR